MQGLNLVSKLSAGKYSQPWRVVSAALKQNGTAFKLHYGGIEPWEYMKQNPKQEELLSKCMTNADVIGEAPLRK